MRRFPHLQQTSDSFPYDNTRVYEQYQNNFDYTRWESQTVLKPCTVRWTIDSEDRVKWVTDIERDDYFNNLSNESYTLDSGLNIIPGESVRLPIPYQAMQFANYLAVTIPDMPDDTRQLDYSQQNLTHIYYFVLDTRRINASVTECILAIDYWTTYINSVEIPRIMVERGHVAQSFETVETYLSSPISHTMGLTATEPDAPTSPVLVSDNTFVPLARGEMWLLFAVKCSYSQFTSLTEVGAATASTPPTYADTTDYYGYQYVVNDYQWGDVTDMTNVGAPSTTGISSDNIRPNGYTIIGLPASIAFTDNILNAFTTRLPQVWQLIEACYIVPRDMINPVSQRNLLGYTFYRIEPSPTGVLADIDLTMDKFGYDNRYKNLAKLYTAPYAWLSITDENNAETIIRIEDTTGDLNITRRVSLAYPYLSAQTFLTGVNGDKNTVYEWTDLTNTKHTTDIPASSFSALSTHDIPLFALMIDSATQYMLNNDNSMRAQARQNALNTYHTSVRPINTTLVNATDSANTNVTNTTATNATNIANTQRSTSASVENTTTTNTNNLNNNNAIIEKTQNDVLYGNTKLTNDVTADINMMEQTFVLDSDAAAMSQITNTVGSMGASIAGGPASVATAAGGALLSTANYAISLTNKTEILDLNRNTAADKLGYAVDTNVNMRDNAINAMNSVTHNNNATATTIANLNKTTTDTNVTATADTANTNATRSRNVTVNNATRSRDNGIFAAQTALKQAQDNYTAKIADLKRSKPVAITNNSGDALPDIWGTRGIQIRVMTQTNDIIKRCGDAFLRYGYTLNENIESPELNIKPNYTYWRGDATIYAINAPTRAVDDISNMFTNGVTIWNNPDKIGSSIYDN